MKCPFCTNQLHFSAMDDGFVVYNCFHEDCMEHDVSKFRIEFLRHKAIKKSYAVGTYYVVAYYNLNISTISTLKVCLLMDTITVNRIIDLDTKNIDKTLEKIKTIVTFS